MLAMLKFLPYIGLAVVIGLCLLFYHNWQSEVQETGMRIKQIEFLSQSNLLLEKQLKECNDKIISSSKSAAASYGQCQDVIKNSASTSFDRGVAFGRATCAIVAPH